MRVNGSVAGPPGQRLLAGPLAAVLRQREPLSAKRAPGATRHVARTLRSSNKPSRRPNPAPQLPASLLKSAWRAGTTSGSSRAPRTASRCPRHDVGVRGEGLCARLTWEVPGRALLPLGANFFLDQKLPHGKRELLCRGAERLRNLLDSLATVALDIAIHLVGDLRSGAPASVSHQDVAFRWRTASEPDLTDGRWHQA